MTISAITIINSELNFVKLKLARKFLVTELTRFIIESITKLIILKIRIII